MLAIAQHVFKFSQGFHVGTRYPEILQNSAEYIARGSTSQVVGVDGSMAAHVGYCIRSRTADHRLQAQSHCWRFEYCVCIAK